MDVEVVDDATLFYKRGVITQTRVRHETFVSL